MNGIYSVLTKSAAKGKQSDYEPDSDFAAYLAIKQFNNRQRQIVKDYESMVPINASLGSLIGGVGGGALGHYIASKCTSDKEWLFPGAMMGAAVGGILGLGLSADATLLYYLNKLNQPMEMTFTHYWA